MGRVHRVDNNTWYGKGGRVLISGVWGNVWVGYIGWIIIHGRGREGGY